MSHEVTTTLLDLLGLLLIVVGVAGGLWPLIGWWALGPAGLVLIGVSQVVTKLSQPGRGDQ